ncbi:cysteate synthase [Candidatus Methanomassiliicoccus intestinalis]|uniref:cysteate synthase n=1 Tax=Candidatus Methanomassiliicoccus intestinalis TaxID=1406512 RepID=UPI0037DC486E
MGKYSLANENNGLPRTVYENAQINIASYPGIWKFIDWLPVDNILNGFDGGCVTYKSSGLSRELGLNNLYIAFNGYWPEINANLDTCSFKDLEAGPTVEMLHEKREKRILTVASAGNTARAFANTCHLADLPLLLVVPKNSLSKLWIPENVPEDKIFLLCVDGDYSEAISVSDRICELSEFVPEGGAKNIARRDGMGTVMLDAASKIKRIPDYYFQAVGSGTGGISAWEASMRLINDGRFGNKLPVLKLAQNVPCAPLFNSVHGGTYSKDCPRGMYDGVLFNRKPPYSVPGGVAGALAATSGTIDGMTNEQAEKASQTFYKAEGIDIMNAASIAVAALINNCETGKINKNDIVLLNITGGGEVLYKKEKSIKYLNPDITVKPDDADISEISKRIINKLEASIYA